MPLDHRKEKSTERDAGNRPGLYVGQALAKQLPDALPPQQTRFAMLCACLRERTRTLARPCGEVILRLLILGFLVQPEDGWTSTHMLRCVESHDAASECATQPNPV